MLKDACQFGLLTSNPLDDARVQPSRGRPGDTPPMQAILDIGAAGSPELLGPNGLRCRVFLHFAVFGAGRPGEMFALKWEDIENSSKMSST